MKRLEPLQTNGPALVLAPLGRDGAVISAMLRDAGINPWEQTNLQELVTNLKGAAAAVIAEEALRHQDRDALARWIAEQPPWSDFPFVLLTLRTAHDNPAVPELIQLLGNVTVLERPLAAASLQSAARAAVRGRARQRQAEQYLDALQQLAESLEKRVADRTQQLSDANKRLMAEMAERERTELALRQAQKMEAVGQLTGGIAHDFNNLLMTIIGNLELLAARLDDERLQRYLRNAMHGAQRGARLVQQLLAFSRKQHLAPEPVDINELVSEVAELLSRTIGSGVRIEVAAQKELWPALVDATQLELMLLNLAFNARDAMPTGGTLTIETASLDRVPEELARDLPAGQYVSIAVRDTGTGMTPEVLARAFDPFFTTKASGKGTGLGLSQVYGFARQSGGIAKIESEVGEGTRVRLFLPRSLKPIAGKDECDANPKAAIGKETVLIVDDDTDVLETTCGMLDNLGYKTVVADHAAAALRALDSNAVDLAIVDLGMPGTSGLELGLQLQQRKPDLAVLFCSGYPDLIAANGKRADNSLFLHKPYSSRELAVKIEAVLRTKSALAPADSTVMSG
jgi:signal transduction histidine kinase/ActR/RegA family two-component response regulator